VVFIAIVAVVIWRIGFKKEVALVPGGKPSLAVLYFKNNTGDADFEIWRSALSDSIITDLSQSRYINVLSTDRLLSVLRKLGLLEATGYASEDLERIAAEGGANHVLQGTLSRAGDLFRIDYTLQEVGSGKIIGTSRVEGRGEASMFAMVDELTRKIKQDLKLSEAEIAGDFDKSIGQITTSSPEAYKLYIEAARLHSLGENRKAIPYYEKAVSIDSEFATAYRSMGIAYNNLGYAAKSREYRKKAFELSDRVSDRERYRNAAEYYALSDRTVDKEIEAFKKLLALYPDDRSANTNLGVTYMLLEEWDLAIERLNICLQLKDESPYAYSALAWCYMAKGKFEEAREILELYLDDFSENAYIRFSAADQYLCGGKYELAYAEIDRALALAPDDFTYIFTKGIIHQCEGNLAEAEKEYQRLLELEEPVAQVWRLSCMENLRVLQGKITESQDFLKTAIESVRKTEEKYWECLFLYRSSYNHLLLGNPQQALPLMDRVMNLSLEWENDFWRMMALHMKGMAALKLKDRDIALEAAGELKKVLDKSSYKKEIRLYYHLMGQIEMEKNNLPKATEYFEKAVSLLPGQSSILFEEGHAQYMDSLAMAYFQAGDLEKAREEYEKILTLTTGRFYFGDIYAKSFYMLGKIAEQRGGKSEAIERYSQFLDLWKDADPGIPEVEDARRRLEGLRALNPS
jgi:tetratricopeptide (TPR) repeat protein